MNTPKQVADFLKANLLYSCIMNIAIDKKAKKVEFDSVDKYVILTSMKLPLADLPLWDLYGDFTSHKNAVASLLYCIENKSGITPEIFKQQSKLTPKKEMPKVAHYNDFIATLTPEEKTFLLTIANEWLTTYCNGETSFEAFFINGSNGLTLKEGDLVMGYDELYAQAVATRVFQACPNGFVTCLDDGGTFTLAKHINPRLAKAEEIGVDLVKEFEAFDLKQRDNISEDRAKVIAQVQKKAEQTKKIEDAEIARKEKAAKAAEDKKKADASLKAEFAELEKLTLDSPDKIAKAVERLNVAKLPKEQHDLIHAKLKVAKAAISSTTKTTATPATAEKAQPATPAKATSKKEAPKEPEPKKAAPAIKAAANKKK